MSDSRTSIRPRSTAKKPHHIMVEDQDRIKEREFYRYYHPSPHTKDYTRPHSPPTVGTVPSLPTPSEDQALTSFCQLGALRLKTRRCLISFFDRRNCYVLAEATKTLCLKSGRAELEEDVLHWGTAIFPKEESVCYTTVKLPFGLPTRPDDEYSAVPSLVVDDLSQDSRFKSHPMVVGGPRARFYASVPIRSPNGHSIGTYSVMDDKPRCGVSDFELLFLKDMATTITRHLQMSRATDDHLRGGIMVRSLGSFAEGRSSLDEWLDWEADLAASTALDDVENPQPRHPHRPTLSHVDSSQSVSRSPMLLPRNNSNSSGIPSLKTLSTLSPSLTPGSTVDVVAPNVIEAVKSEVTTKTASSTNGQSELISPELKAIFSRAAQMIVDATEAEGAVFFDAKVSTWGGLVDDDVPADQPPEPDKSCIVLGAAHYRREGLLPQSSYGYNLSENELKHLLRNYAHGQIFNLEEESITAATSPDIMSDDAELDFFRKSESSRSFDDEIILKNIFPTARSLILYPLWDTHRGKWFASLVVWSIDPMRVFTNEQELSYLAAFSNSVMAEVTRLDTKVADSAKADFISSISHELRSPLHGILGMSDLLKETQIDSQQSSHIQTIETCGKTLLDTINHVLDYAKINNLTRGSSKRRLKRSKTTKHISPGQGHTNDIMTIISDVDMSVLVEEALDSVFAGFRFQQSANLDISNKPASLPVTVIVDINKSDNYIFRTQPGAWRRVIMNLFGNALKYTPAGYIKIKLHIVPDEDASDDCAELRLTVTDSGIGMSEGYINNRLFHSFAQENPLSQGTGLGLSIVKQLVELLGGDVEVRSERGRGTKFTVCCPMKLSMLSPSVNCSLPNQTLLNVSKRTHGLNVHFIGFDQEDDQDFPSDNFRTKNTTQLTKKAVESLCVDWFHMRTWTYGAADAPSPDLFIATEWGAQYLRTHHSKNPGMNKIAPPVVVLCRGAASAQSTTAITVPGLIFECTAQPCGPHKLAKALSSCLDRHANRVMVESTASDSPVTLYGPQVGLKENHLPPIPSRIPALEPSRPSMTPTFSAPEIRSIDRVKDIKETLDPKRSLNCLLVDDNPINLRLLKTFVAKLGHRHVLAKTGLEALEAYKLNYSERMAADNASHLRLPSIDVVLMDINMPEMDGLESTRQIRAFERDNGLSPTTIIALTGVASTDTQQEAHASGINLFLIKPVRLAELDPILKSVIKSHEQNEICAKARGVTHPETQDTEKQMQVVTVSLLDPETEEKGHVRSKSEM
ncbi:hypothetical protein DM02DRAFT_556852 [Periconia macrospinosa]|uniref:Sensor histidine kinase-like protein/response regulator n=1 Tax=Periconia macrospinosa TaxID=97972 RepID=A0A2V1E0R5_9PLEO|nr:hypothetical protein DM02DRAFT_556852 [Periconia macrospinosa]